MTEANDVSELLRLKRELKTGAEDKRRRWHQGLMQVMKEAKADRYTIDYSSIDKGLSDEMDKFAKEQKHPWTFETPDPTTMPIASFLATIFKVNETEPTFTADWVVYHGDYNYKSHSGLYIDTRPPKERFDDKHRYCMKEIRKDAERRYNTYGDGEGCR